MTYVSKTFYSPKNYMEPTKSISSHGISNNIASSVGNGNSTAAWNSSKALLNKEVKDKNFVFKSQKYIRDYKGLSTSNTNDTSILVKK